MKFSPIKHKNRQKIKCCAPFCSSVSDNKHNELRFHKFPGDDKILKRKNLFNNAEYVFLRDQWFKNLNLKYNSKDVYVCSLHFNKEDYIFAGDYF